MKDRRDKEEKRRERKKIHEKKERKMRSRRKINGLSRQIRKMEDEGKKENYKDKIK